MVGKLSEGWLEEYGVRSDYSNLLGTLPSNLYRAAEWKKYSYFERGFEVKDDEFRDKSKAYEYE